MKFRDIFFRKQADKKAAEQSSVFAKKAQDFALDNPNALLILCDINTDVMFGAYSGICAPVRLVGRDGKPLRIVNNFLKHTRGDGDIDRFLLAVDGIGYAIAKALYDNRRNSLIGKVLKVVAEDNPPAESNVVLADGARVSPLQLQDA